MLVPLMSSYADSASEDLGRPPGVSPAPDDDRVLLFLFSTADAIETKARKHWGSYVPLTRATRQFHAFRVIPGKPPLSESHRADQGHG